MKAVNVTWLEQHQNVIHFEFPAHWTTDDFSGAQESARLLAASVPYRVDLLLDLRKSLHTPANVMALFSSLFTLKPGRIGSLLFITHNSFQRALVEVIQRVNAPLKRTVLLISTPDEIAALNGESNQE